MKRMTSGERAFSVFNHVFFVSLALLMIYPFWYVLMLSLSGLVDLSSPYLVPLKPTAAAYVRVLSLGRALAGYRNSAIVVLAGTGISMTLTTLMAFPLSRRTMPFRRAVLWVATFTMLFNGGMIPTYLVVRAYGLLNTLWALFLPQAVSVYNLLIMMRFFMNLPDSLIEAAVMDGYNDFQMLLTLVVPLSRAVLAAVGLFYAVAYWNAFFPALIYLTDVTKYPIQTYLYTIVKDAQAAFERGPHLISELPEPFQMATAILTMLPIILVYPFLQRHFISGIMLGSIKE